MNASSRNPAGPTPSVSPQFEVKSANRPSCETLARGVSQDQTN